MTSKNDGSTGIPLRETFADPPDEHGPVPLWWWDGEPLDETRLTEQLQELRDNGVPSVCFISKYPTGESGDENAYFSDEWWERLEHVARECRRLGMQLWVHDETYHHSPPNHRKYWQHRIETEAGSRPEYRGKALSRIAADVDGGETAMLDLPDEFEPLTVAAYPRRDDGRVAPSRAVVIDADSHTEQVEWTPPGDGTWHVAAIGREPAGLCYTKPDVVERYIDLHFEAYVRRLGKGLVDDVLAGTFEDELLLFQPEYPHDRTLKVPADERVFTRFREEHGYDPQPDLIGLYEDIGDETPCIRANYYDVVTALVEENWFEPLYEWHEEHGLQRSHDNFGRLSLSKQTVQYGDYFRTMRWYQAPGYDDGNIDPKAIETVENIPIGERNFFDAKLAASVATCYDRERVWGELFHSTGWGFTPERQLAGIAENVCYGMTLYDKHGLYYTTRGGWWEHAPPDTHFRQPYWDHIEGLNEAATRLCYLFSQGNPVVDAAILYPATSMHAAWRPDEGIDAAGNRVDDETRALAESLYKTGSDVIFTDHETLVDAAVDDGTLNLAGTEVPAIVLGPITTLRRDTVETLRRFHSEGGVVIAVGRLPNATVEGGRGDELLVGILEEIFGTSPYEERSESETEPLVNESDTGGIGVVVDAEPDDPSAFLGRYVDRDIRADTPAIYHTHRSIGDRDVYLLLNTEQEEREIHVSLRGEGSPSLWDALDGSTERLYTYTHEDGYTEFDITLAPYEFEIVLMKPVTDDEKRVVESTLEEVTGCSVAPVSVDGPVCIDGTVDTGGRHTGQVVRDDTSFAVESKESAPEPEEISLDGSWTFEPDPVLDNEWGDFRYPPSDRVLGPEIRRFNYRIERPGEDGREQEWYAGNIHEDNWQNVELSHGPYFWRRTGVEDFDPGPIPSNDDPRYWTRYSFSKATGKADGHPDMAGLVGRVADDFLVSPDGEGRNYFWTTIRSAENQAVRCHYGTKIERIELGERTIEPTGIETQAASRRGTAVLSLPSGTTPVLIEVEPGCTTHFAVEPVEEDTGEHEMSDIPRVRWFRSDSTLEFDSRPWDDSPVGWYNFTLPVGTRSFDLPLRGSSEVWIDGEPRPVDDGTVTVANPADRCRDVTVRVEHEQGSYGGAAWTAPIQVDAGSAEVNLADWREFGFTSYSGMGQYRTTIPVPERIRDRDRAILDLGDVAVSARASVDGVNVGTRFASPYQFDISDAVEPGEDHTVEIEVANTVANHFDSEVPTQYVYDSLNHRTSGLLGPVTLRFEPTVTLAPTGDSSPSTEHVVDDEQSESE